MVKLKWGMEYKGVLKSFDNYFNLQVCALLLGLSCILLPPAYRQLCLPRRFLCVFPCCLDTPLQPVFRAAL